jgi:hypothetical protein
MFLSGAMMFAAGLVDAFPDRGTRAIGLYLGVPLALVGLLWVFRFWERQPPPRA